MNAKENVFIIEVIQSFVFIGMYDVDHCSVN